MQMGRIPTGARVGKVIKLAVETHHGNGLGTYVDANSCWHDSERGVAMEENGTSGNIDFGLCTGRRKKKAVL